MQKTKEEETNQKAVTKNEGEELLPPVHFQ